MPRYKVMVDDNFHYQNPGKRWEQGVYETVDEALAVCRGLVDRSLKEEYRLGNSAEALYDRYTSFGDDPFIMVLDGVDDRATFSAWNYAKERCSAICGEHPAGAAARPVRSSER
jgi:hypothetical protein